MVLVRLEQGLDGYLKMKLIDPEAVMLSGQDIVLDIETVVPVRVFDKTVPLGSQAFGRPPTNPPLVVIQDDVHMLAFTVDTDRVFYQMAIPLFDYYGGGLSFAMEWTNDGGVDDNGRYVRWVLYYKISREGLAITGDTGNLPVEDTYDSAAGWIEHRTGFVNIPHAELDGQDCLFVRLRAETPLGGLALTCDPHLIGLCLRYRAYTTMRGE